MNLLDKIEEIICDIEGLSTLLSLAGISVNDNSASTALIYAGRTLEHIKTAVEETENAVEDLTETVKRGAVA